MFGKLEEYLGIFGEMALTIDDGISSRTISTQCFPGENCQELPVPSSLGGIDIEESFCLESFDGCAGALEVTLFSLQLPSLMNDCRSSYQKMMVIYLHTY